ncbi:DinB family protein [Vineibacter terrae]|uniref:DinB family protein n=1 Tax=Vineibacter terrae TaxID=2586908 RepID=UPI002E32FEF2|nr:DinB family protein [Vineibacter terrae]HEX2889413.1 DinB family protein [Vineibacter terrae]
MKGTAMLTLPYRTLMHYKRWATNGLNAVIAENLDHIAADERVLVLRLLDHIQAVDEIFGHNLEARPHGYQAPRSAEIPSFDTLADKARSTADWYADYADALRPEKVDEVIAFSFANGEPARMTRGEMLLHVAMHAAGHRGQVALLLQKNGIQPYPDRITDFLAAEDAGAQRQVNAEVTP